MNFSKFDSTDRRAKSKANSSHLDVFLEIKMVWWQAEWINVELLSFWMIFGKLERSDGMREWIICWAFAFLDDFHKIESFDWQTGSKIKLTPDGFLEIKMIWWQADWANIELLCTWMIFEKLEHSDGKQNGSMLSFCVFEWFLRNWSVLMACGNGL